MKWIPTVFLTMCIGLGSLNAQHQDSTARQFKHEVRLLVDNDVFTSMYRDQYYTSGIFLQYRWLGNSANRNYKMIKTLSFNHRIYTPEYVSWTDTAEFDRPYAGLMSLNFDHQFYWAKNHYLKTGMEIGWMGPATGIDDFQTIWHEILGIPVPAGWRYQVGNSPIVNFHGTHGARIVGSRYADVLTETNLALGTTFNHIRQEFMFRLGAVNSTYRSIAFNGQLGGLKPTKTTDVPSEIFLFYAPGLEYNIYNATIEGNIIGGDNPHTEVAESWIVQHKAGLSVSWPAFDIHIAYYFRTRETTESIAHQYVGIHLNARF